MQCRRVHASAPAHTAIRSDSRWHTIPNTRNRHLYYAHDLYISFSVKK